MMLSMEQVETTIEQLEEVRQGIIQLKPSKSEAERLNRIYNAIRNAQRELSELAGIDQNEGGVKS